MEVHHERVDNVISIAPLGRVDSITCKDLEERLKQIVPSDATPLIMDLGGVDYISSAGLRVLLAMAKRSAAANGKLALYGLNHNVKEIFDVSGFSNIFSIYESRDTAMAVVAG